MWLDVQWLFLDIFLIYFLICQISLTFIVLGFIKKFSKNEKKKKRGRMKVNKLKQNNQKKILWQFLKHT